MWLTKQLEQRDRTKLSTGEVASGERQFAVKGESEYRSPELLAPYGFSSRAAGGRKAVMLDGLCAGVSELPDNSLEEGEVRLYSSGGAEILLKNTGEVVINGHSFPPE